jgi:hypothetical protein
MRHLSHRLAPILLALAASKALAWNAHGHRTVTRLALDGLSPDTPSWLHDPVIIARIADQSNDPDRWRGTRLPAILHDANQEHYIDVEDLAPMGLALATLPEYRYEGAAQMARGRAEHPEAFPAIDPKKNADHTREWAGFLPWAIAEHYAKLESEFNTMRILEAVNDPQRAAQLQQARENIISEMGLLSHFVGDGAQPLHTTRNHHGWVGENPHGYTTDNGFHAFVDGKILEIHHLDYDALRSRMKFEAKIAGRDPWAESLVYIQRSFDQVEPLYKMQKDGSLTQDAGKDLIADRLCDAGSMLAAMYNSAWEHSKPTAGEISSFVKFSEQKPAPEAPPAPAPTPRTP